VELLNRALPLIRINDRAGSGDLDQDAITRPVSKQPGEQTQLTCSAGDMH
jgi:hypothetical protein